MPPKINLYNFSLIKNKTYVIFYVTMYLIFIRLYKFSKYKITKLIKGG